MYRPDGCHVGESAAFGVGMVRSFAPSLSMILSLVPSTNAMRVAEITGPWDRRSDASIQRNGGALARIVTGWIALDTTSFRPLLLYPDTIGSSPAIAERKTALITSYFGSRFHPEIIRGLGDNPEIAASTAGSIASVVDSGDYKGVIIDFEGMTPRDLDQLVTVTRAVADSVRAHGV